MGIEIEYKLHVADEAALDRLLTAPELESLRITPWRETRMKTTYYDTLNGCLSDRRWMLRLRKENGVGIVCLKTPLPGQEGRGEWQISAEAVDAAAIEHLIEAGAPEELRELCAGGLCAVCGAEFLRRSAMLELPDGSRAEAAGDCGRLFGKTQTLPFTELELELYHGGPEATKHLVATLCQRYGLSEEPQSKAARARALR